VILHLTHFHKKEEELSERIMKRKRKKKKVCVYEDISWWRRLRAKGSTSWEGKQTISLIHFKKTKNRIKLFKI